ncbi:hypothetical protein BDM02DRAFT_3111177, partial [Thelephora ganbajun]
TNGTRVPGKETLSCGECKKRDIACGGVWRFYSQHGKYILQCRTCRLKRRGCPFRDDDEFQKSPRKRKDKVRVGKGQRAQSPILISDSDESSKEENRVAGPSSRPEKKIKIEGREDYDKLKDTLLVARKKRVEIQTEAEIELAKVDDIIEEAERDLRKTVQHKRNQQM